MMTRQSGQTAFDRFHDSLRCAWRRMGLVAAVILAMGCGLTCGQSSRRAALEKYRLDPLPAALTAKRSVHPRLYLTADRIVQLRKVIKTTHSHVWEKVRAQAESAVQSAPPRYALRDEVNAEEQLWQRDVGNTMPLLAMAYVLTGEKRYLDRAREWALASCFYKTWGLGPIDGTDLAAGHQLFGLAIVYDWCYEGLIEKDRRTIRKTLAKRATAMAEGAAAGTIWWHDQYLKNHLWVNSCGMMAAGLAVFDEEPDAAKWIGLSLDKFGRAMDALGDDGACLEGMAYWSYGIEHMLKAMDLARDLLDANLYDRPWLRNTAAYRLYLAPPRDSWSTSGTLVDIADCWRTTARGPDYQLRALAREYREGYAQWLAQQIDEADLDGPESRWLNLIWYDPTVAAKPPGGLYTLRHFEDLGIVSARSDWSGHESQVVFKCGPFIGHKAIQEFDEDPGGGHAHPDANHFMLLGGGEWLIRDDGYVAKRTGQHNTLLIDGKGQIGEGKRTFQSDKALKIKPRPRIVRAVSAPMLDHAAGDATEAYPRALGLKRYVRHLLFLKPDVLIVADDIALEEPRELEMRFHPEQRRAENENGAFVIHGPRTTLRLEMLTGGGVAAGAGDLAVAPRYGETGLKLFTVWMTTRRSQWRNAVALSWATGDAKPARVTLREEGEVWRFAAGSRTVALDWKSGEAK